MPLRQPHLTSRLQGLGTSVFAEMTALAVRHSAVNLGQGFPDFDGPRLVKDSAIAAIREGRNQYGRTAGLLELVRAVAEHQRRFYDLYFNPETEVTVCAGATEALCATFLALLEVGDEVVTFQPYYDSYPAAAAMAGATLRAIPLAPPDFRIDAGALAAALTPRTRFVLLNTPGNPCGRVFSLEEMRMVADACVRHDLLAVTDEVYEHIALDAAHVPLATLPGMRERTVTISSAGKTFSFTGWKIGWACASPALSSAIRTAHQFITFCNGTPLQHAIATALHADDAFYASLRDEYRARRDRLCAGLKEAGFAVVVPQGTYFALADIRPLGYEDDVEFCRALPEKAGVAAIPLSAFCGPGAPRHLVRFAFCKTDAVIDEGVRRLRRLRA